MGPLDSLRIAGQSVWSDSISRGMIRSGDLARRIADQAVTGVTSNPTIFHEAVSRSSEYDDDLRRLARNGAGAVEATRELVTADIAAACDVLAPVWEETGGRDGFVSVEVDPRLADDTEGTVDEAREWVKRIGRPNLLVKVPATTAGLGAIRRLVGAGVSVNVTLIFSLDRYREVIEAYLDGLDDLAAAGERLDEVASVASFFVSRIDTEVDARLPESSSLRGTAAVANARAAYGIFLEAFRGDRWERLAASGARAQRPLWASTSTKNPSYPDILYVRDLVAPHTVSTMPLKTLDAYADHGPIRPAILGPEEVAAGRAALRRLADAGVDYADVTATLERRGVESFVASWRSLLDDVGARLRPS